MNLSDDGISLSAPVIMELIEAVHEKGASFRFLAKGYSMMPAIRNGDIITVSPLQDIMPRRGDVLAFRQPERPRLLVHRALRKKGTHYLIQGDNCPGADGWIPAENILGLITKVERQGRVRFWPNRSALSFWSNLYLLFYPLWPPVRRVLVKAWRHLGKSVAPGK